MAKDLIAGLLDAIKVDFPRRKRAAEELFKKFGIKESFDLVIGPPERVEALPTFDRSTFRATTPMLKHRYECGGRWQRGREIWLSPTDMAATMRQMDVLQVHRSLRENWAGSAPMLFSDSDLSLFGTTEDVPEKITYLVWRQQQEPEIWSYVGLESRKFDDLGQYLRWCLERE